MERLSFATGRVSRWVVVAAWLGFAAAAFPVAANLADVTNDELVLPGGSPTARVYELLRERFPGGDTRPVLLVYRRPGGLTQDDRALILAEAREAADVPLAAAPIPAFAPGSPPELVSKSGEVAYTVVPLVAQDVFRFVPSIEALRELDVAEKGGLERHVTGYPALVADINSAVKEADITLLLATGALVLFLLLLIYRSPVLAFLPLLVVGLAYVVAAGIVHVLADASVLRVDSTASSLLLVLMFGAGTDYCLLLVARYRAELRRDEDAHQAVARAVPSSAPAIVASAATVVAALLVMLAGIFGTNRSLGPVNAIGIAVVLLASLTLLPALLSILGRRSFWPSMQAVSARTQAYRYRNLPPPFRPGRWEKLGVKVRERPKAWLVLGLIVLGAGGAGTALYTPDVDVVGQFRESTDGTRGYEALRTGFPPGTVAPVTVLVERVGARIRPPDVEAVAAQIRASPGVEAVVDRGRRSRDGSIAELTMLFSDYPYSAAAVDRVAAIRDSVRRLGPDLRVLLGGGTAERLDYREAASRDFRVIAPLVLAVVLLTLILLLRAIVAPLYLLGTVILSFVGTLGSSLIVFRLVFGQETIDPALPLIVFIFLVALGSDYNIFLMSRVREEAEKSGTNQGIVRALTATGPVITSAGIILAGTFLVLAVLPVYALLEIGLAVALGVLLDTFLVRTLLVPAIGWIVGEASWWPTSPSAERRRAGGVSLRRGA
jgi:putative drug exporter of the RND superfamily